jgi:hypothetical protein
MNYFGFTKQLEVLVFVVDIQFYIIDFIEVEVFFKLTDGGEPRKIAGVLPVICISIHRCFEP